MTKPSYKLGYVIASNYRKKIILALKDKSMTPAEISKKVSIYPSHISTALKELANKNLVVCLTPKLRKGRLYGLTKEGHKLSMNLS
ncbi:MAG: ArsR family transcriptional regulator [Nitrosopumilaceae archaeon]